MTITTATSNLSLTTAINRFAWAVEGLAETGDPQERERWRGSVAVRRRELLSAIEAYGAACRDWGLRHATTP